MVVYKSLLLHSSSFTKKKNYPMNMLCFLWPSRIMSSNVLAFARISSNDTHQAYDRVTMALTFNNNHIICYHMEMKWSIGLAWPISLLLTVWLSSDGSVPQFCFLILLTKQNPIPIIILRSLRVQWATCLWASLVPNSMAVIDFSNPALPFVLTPYPALWITPNLIMLPQCHKISGLI